MHGRLSPRERRLLRSTEPPEEIDDEVEDDVTDEDTEDTDPTSIRDLTQPADPQEFDETFTDGDANLRLEGSFDPVAGSKQVIPRVAYTINFNFVWNADRQRWEPDTGNSGGGAFEVVASGQIQDNESNFPLEESTGLLGKDRSLIVVPSLADPDTIDGTGKDFSIITPDLQDTSAGFQSNDLINAFLLFDNSAGEWNVKFFENNLGGAGNVTVEYDVLEVSG